MYDEVGEDLVAGDVQQQTTTDGKLHVLAGFLCAQFGYIVCCITLLLLLLLLLLFSQAGCVPDDMLSSSSRENNPTKVHPLSIIHWKPIMTLLLLLLFIHLQHTTPVPAS
jgi:hypothetical protein